VNYPSADRWPIVFEHLMKYTQGVTCPTLECSIQTERYEESRRELLSVLDCVCVHFEEPGVTLSTGRSDHFILAAAGAYQLSAELYRTPTRWTEIEACPDR